MVLKDIILKSPEENILYDEVLLNLAEHGKQGESLRFWESKELFVVLGRICDEHKDLNAKNISEDNIKVLRRASGGGTVLQGVGCINYSLILSKQSHPELSGISNSYKFILSKIISALKFSGVNAEFMPISDIALINSSKKISGNAQKRSRNYILQHGTILYDFDLDLIARYLHQPEQMPEYRNNRSHLDFVSNAAISIDVFKQKLMLEFNADHKENSISDEERSFLRDYLYQRDISLNIGSAAKYRS